MNEHRKQTANKIIETLDLPQDIFKGMPILTLSGNRELYISNHRGILSYGEEEMIILSKEYQLQVNGRSLSIESYSKDELTLKGYIHSIKFI